MYKAHNAKTFSQSGRYIIRRYTRVGLLLSNDQENLGYLVQNIALVKDKWRLI